MKFRYEGHDRMGRPQKGSVEAENQEKASEILRANDVFALKLEPATDEPMKTVLDHPEASQALDETKEMRRQEAQPQQQPVDVEAEIEAVKQEAGVEDDELEADLKDAVEISQRISIVLGGSRNRITENSHVTLLSEQALKEMVTEAACQAFNRAQVRRMPKGL